MNLHTLTFIADDDDHRDIYAAIAAYQRARRTENQLMIGDGDGDLAARILGSICRAWMDANNLI
jgi:hypothetical protein